MRGWTLWILLLGAAVALAALSLSTRDRAAEPPPPTTQRVTEAPSQLRRRTIAFDNRYGAATEIRTFIQVDKSPEQMLTARCTPSTCTFELPLTDGKHELVLAVEQDAYRSESTRVTIDTSGR